MEPVLMVWKTNTLWLFLKSNAGKNKQFLILISRHPRECGAVRKVEKN